MEQRRSW